MRNLVMILCVVVLIIMAVYAFPVSKVPFDEVYAKVPEKVSASLLNFRSSHNFEQIEVDETTWNYIATGKGPEVILLLHGMTGAYDIWWQIIALLKDRYRIVSLTYPPLDSLEELSRGIMAILDQEQLTQVNLVGSSLGGYLAQYLIQKHPDKIKKAVFANTFPPNDIIAEKNRIIGKVLPFLPEWVIMRILRGSVDKAIFPASGNSEIVRAFIIEETSGRMSKEQFVARFHCVIDPFTPPDVKALNIPVLIIESDNDPLVEPKLRGMLKKTYPTAKVETLHAVGHFPYLNKPESYASILDGFFQNTKNEKPNI